MRDEGRGLKAETLGRLISNREASRGFSLSPLIPLPCSFYSARSAVIGLTPSARRAGTIAASAPAMIRTNAMRA